MYGKSDNTMKCTVFFYFMIIHSSSPKSDCKNENITYKLWGKVSFTVIIASMLPEIVHKIFFSLLKIKETPSNAMFSFTNFH